MDVLTYCMGMTAGMNRRGECLDAVYIAGYGSGPAAFPEPFETVFSGAFSAENQFSVCVIHAKEADIFGQLEYTGFLYGLWHFSDEKGRFIVNFEPVTHDGRPVGMRPVLLIADGADCAPCIPQLDWCVTVYRGM